MYIYGQVFTLKTLIQLYIYIYIYITAILLNKNKKKYKENYMIKYREYL